MLTTTKPLSGFRITIRWNNPYTQPPDGKPRILAEHFVLQEGNHGCPPAPPCLHKVIEEVGGLGCGYSIHCQYIASPMRQLSDEAKSSIRRKRLERRINGKFPMFAGEFVSEAIARKPEYFEGKDDPALAAARQRVLDRETARYARFLEYTQRNNKE